MSNWYIYPDGVLRHHGIDGQKWGHRNGPPYPLDETQVSSAERKKGFKESKWADGKPEGYKPQKLSRAEKKEQRRNDLIEKHKAAGYSEKKAVELTDSRLRAEKALKIAGAVAVAGLAVYAGHKLAKEYAGGKIAAGNVLQRIEKDANTVVDGRVFYASMDKRDNELYRDALPGIHFRSDAYLKQIGAQKDIKVASPAQAKKLYTELKEKDPEFKLAAEALEKYSRQGAKGYDAFNQSIPMYQQMKGTVGSNEAVKAYEKFFDGMKQKGFGAIFDVNDQKYSGYNAKKPVIIFDTTAAKNIGQAQKISANYWRGNRALMEAQGRKQRVEGLYSMLGRGSAVAGVAAGAKALEIREDKKRLEDKKKK